MVESANQTGKAKAVPASGFWREWGPVVSCALLSAAGLYVLFVSNTAVASTLLVVLVLGCPLAIALMWQAQRRHVTIKPFKNKEDKPWI